MTFFTLNDFVAIGEAGFDVGPISLSLNAGEILAIVGATGSGKTLLLESIAHLLPHRGERQMPSTNQEENKVGMVFQNHALLDELTVLENVALAATCAQLSNPNERACEQLANVDLLDAKDQKPAEISGGMKRRCGLARAMVTDPSLLLCDEVTAGLDPLTTQKIFSLIQHFVKGREKGIILTTHDVDHIVPKADTVLVLHQGEVIWMGPPQNIGHDESTRVFQAVQVPNHA